MLKQSWFFNVLNHRGFETDFYCKNVLNSELGISVLCTMFITYKSSRDLFVSRKDFLNEFLFSFGAILYDIYNILMNFKICIYGISKLKTINIAFYLFKTHIWIMFKTINIALNLLLNSHLYSR